MATVFVAVIGCRAAPRVDGTFAVGAQGRSLNGPPSTCAADGWSEAAPVVATPKEWPAQFLSISALDHHLVFAGDTIGSPERMVASHPFSVAVDDHVVSVPEAARDGLYPRIAADRQHAVLRVLWGIAASQSIRFPVQITSLWGADLSVDGRWTEPRRLDSAQRFYLDDWTTARPATDTLGRVSIVVPSLTEKGPRLTVLTHDGTQWSLAQLMLSGFAAYAAIAPLGGDSLAVAYLDDAGAWLVFSLDRGASWNARRPIPAVALESLSLQLASFDGALHVMWAAPPSATAGIRSRTLIHVSTGDSGGTWTAPDSLPVPTGFTRFRSVVSHCGIEVVTDDYPQPDQSGAIMYARWMRHWSALYRPIAGISHGADVVVDANGMPVIAGLRKLERGAARSFTTVVTHHSP